MNLDDDQPGYDWSQAAPQQQAGGQATGVINGQAQPFATGTGTNIPPPPDLSNKWMWNGTAWVQNAAPPYYANKEGDVNPGWSIGQGGAPTYSTPAGGGGGTGGGGTGGGGGSALPSGSLGSLLQPYGVPQPTYVNPDGANLWDQIGAAPSFPTLPSFNEPTGEEAANKPGYAFARDQALQGLTNSAAARGVTNTGGTLEDIVKFGNQFATQNYQTTRANALEDYQNNVWAQYLAPYQAAQSNWQTRAGLVPSIASSASNSAANQNNFNRGTWQDAYAGWRNRNLDTFNQLYALDTLGSNVA